MIDRATGFDDERQGAVRYLVALREHWLLIAGLVAAAVAIAAAYAFTATERYEATADVLIQPVNGNDDLFVGLPVLSGGSIDARPVVTAARQAATPEVADAVARRIGGTRGGLLASISVSPLSQASILALTGKSSNPLRAAQISNAFANEFIARRDAEFERALQVKIRTLYAQVRPLPSTQRDSPRATALLSTLGSLQALVGTGDPSVALSSRAVVPGAPVWPRPALSIAVAFIAALLLGTGIAVALELVSPRVTREDELQFGHRLSILARVPRMRKSIVRGNLTGRTQLPGDVREAYRTLRANLTSSSFTAGAREERFPQLILVTSAIPGEGKTMTSVNLAKTLAGGGVRTILVDGDLRRPMVATVFGVPAGRIGFADLLAGRATIDEGLISAPGYGDELRLLLASPEQAALIDLMEPRRVERVLAEMRLEADVVVIDSPPLTEVADALTLADEADAVVVAVRLGRTRRDRLTELRRMLAQRGIFPAGVVVTGRRGSRRSYYYGASDRQPPRTPRASLRRARRPERRELVHTPPAENGGAGPADEDF